jgi:hypothetical protein
VLCAIFISETDFAIDSDRQTESDRHRKDNSEWDKRIERHLGQIERRQKTKEGASKGNVIPFIPGIKMMSERKATEMAENGEFLMTVPRCQNYL